MSPSTCKCMRIEQTKRAPRTLILGGRIILKPSELVKTMIARIPIKTDCTKKTKTAAWKASYTSSLFKSICFMHSQFRALKAMV